MVDYANEYGGVTGALTVVDLFIGQHAVPVLGTGTAFIDS